MENLKAVLDKATKEELQPVEQAPNKVIEPTEAEIIAIIEAFKNGDDILKVKKEIRRTEGKAQFGFSMAQLRKIRQGWVDKVKELEKVETPEEV